MKVNQYIEYNPPIFEVQVLNEREYGVHFYIQYIKYENQLKALFFIWILKNTSATNKFLLFIALVINCLVYSKSINTPPR